MDADLNVLAPSSLQEKVLGLDVPVRDPALVQEHQGVQHLHDDLRGDKADTAARSRDSDRKTTAS